MAWKPQLRHVAAASTSVSSVSGVTLDRGFHRSAAVENETRNVEAWEDGESWGWAPSYTSKKLESKRHATDNAAHTPADGRSERQGRESSHTKGSRGTAKESWYHRGGWHQDVDDKSGYPVATVSTSSSSHGNWQSWGRDSGKYSNGWQEETSHRTWGRGSGGGNRKDYNSWSSRYDEKVDSHGYIAVAGDYPGYETVESSQDGTKASRALTGGHDRDGRRDDGRDREDRDQKGSRGGTKASRAPAGGRDRDGRRDDGRDREDHDQKGKGSRGGPKASTASPQQQPPSVQADKKNTEAVSDSSKKPKASKGSDVGTASGNAQTTTKTSGNDGKRTWQPVKQSQSEASKQAPPEEKARSWRSEGSRRAGKAQWQPVSKSD